MSYFVGRTIIGLDPGSLCTGFGVVFTNNISKIEHIAHGTIRLDGKKPMAMRLKDLALDLMHLLDKYRPDEAVVEDVFLYRNARSALTLGQARGAILAVLGLKLIEAHHLSPTAIKSAIAGRGRAQKFQLAKIVALELGIDIPEKEDASDALAAALALSFMRGKNFAESRNYFAIHK